ncbi:MAG: hypothetical protein M1839_001632 [Geoglossum umbratile]|nr:MAG: hypothetical protein M1839_001632 [Geoglossum umbratile]
MFSDLIRTKESDAKELSDEPLFYEIEIWETVIRIAKGLPYRPPMQFRLLQIIDSLIRDLKETPEIDNWIDASTQLKHIQDPTELEAQTISNEWLNLNSFAARRFGVGTTGWSNFALWAMRDALEGGEKVIGGITSEVSVLVVSEWIVQSGQEILRICQSEPVLDKEEVRSLGPDQDSPTGSPDSRSTAGTSGRFSLRHCVTKRPSLFEWVLAKRLTL